MSVLLTIAPTSRLITRIGRKFLFILVAGLMLFTQAGTGYTVRAAPDRELAANPLIIDPPTISLGGLGNAMIGSTVTFMVTFNNNDPENQTGYGPFIEFELPTIGADGAGAATDDGLTFVSASYLGSPIPAGDLFVLTLDGGGNATHPLVRDTSGAYITVNGTAGNQYVVIRLPFGSFAPDQPPATVSVTVQMSNLADLGTLLTVRARGGYQYSLTPLDDWCCENIVATLSGYTTGSVIPTVMTFSKTYLGPANTSAETATGPNFTRQYTVAVDIANGQTVTNLTITDYLPNNEQYVPTASTTPAGILVAEPVPGAAQNPPDNDLVVNWGSVTGGTGASDASTTFSFFIPRDDAGGARVIDPSTGAAVPSCNQAEVSGSWTPVDARDIGQVVTIAPAGCEHTLTDRSLATQKSVTVVGGGNPAAGQTLEYTLEVQVSDFFAFDGIFLTDIVSDGQSFDAGFVPQMTVSGNGFVLGASDMTNYTVVSNKDLTDGPPIPPLGPENPATDGTTTVTFNISNEVAARATSLPAGDARTHAEAGRLLGGCVPLTGSASPDCSYNDGGTTVTIVFRTVIDESFTDDYPSGDWSVDQGDILDDVETVTGQLLNTLTFSSSGLPLVTDDATASLTIGTGVLSKEIYAINGTLCPDVVVCPAGGAYRIKPGDDVTYRITYVMPVSDEENLELTDYLPLPIFYVADPDADDYPAHSNGPAWSFVPTVSAAVPASGAAKFGPFDTFYAYSGIAPTLTANATNNRLAFTYGDYDDPRDQSTTIDLLFTVTVSTEPFADGLYLTNQAHAYEGSTNGGLVTADIIVQVILTEPVLVTKKSVIWTDNLNAAYSPALPVPPVTFLAPVNSPRWSGTINSSNLWSGSTSTIDHDISGVDAGDIISFAIVIENQGSSLKGAFDIDILDTLPGNFQMPSGGYNLQIYYGNGTGPIAYTRPDGSPATAGDLFTTGIRLVDPVGVGVCQAHDPNLGNNIILITYDTQVSSAVTPGTLENTGAITHYAGDEGGPSHVPPTSPIEDDADVTTVTSMTKTLVGTEINNATNSAAQVVIGELVTYQLVITIPEGVTPAAQVVDTLDAGLAFVDLDPANPPVLSAGLSITGSAVPVITNTGHTVTFSLGNVANTDTDNTTPQTITITYRAVVLNVAGNQTNTRLNNSAVYSWTGGSQPAVSAAEVTVIEPDLSINKTIAPNTGDAGDAFTYTITLSGPTVTDAFDVTLDETFPALMENLVLTGVTDSASAITTANFNLTGNVLTTVTPWDMLISATPRTITLTFTGTVSYLANPQQTIDNVATVRWTSLSGTVTDRSTYNTDSDERTGAGGVNDYAKSNAATSARYTVNSIVSNKYFIITSEAHTSDLSVPPMVAIGEIVRYRLVVPIPEGTSPNFQIRDNLPSGLTFIGDGPNPANYDSSVRISFVTNGAGIASSGYGTLPIAAVPGGCNFGGNSANATSPARPLTCILGDTNIGSSDSTAADPDVYVTGTDVFFKLGTLLNSDSDGDQEFVVIEFNVLVDNTSAGSNDAGDNRDNNFNIFVGGTQIGANSTTVQVRVSEPSIINLDKTAVPASGDAGDVIAYTLTFSNANGVNNTTAFDIHITDIIPAGMTFNAGSMNIASVGNCATGVTDNTVAPNVDISIATVPAGCAVTVTYTATLNTSVPPQAALDNRADITYTSLPGAGTPVGPSNDTGSVTPGASGSATGERNGTLPPIVAPNDYHDLDTASVTVPNVIITKQITATSASHTSGSDVAIGEVVSYAILLTFPEGTTAADTVFDNIPAGLAVVAGTPQMITSAAASGGLLTADFNGSVGTLSITTDTSDGGSVQYDFTNVVATGDNVTTNNTILLTFDARVTNILANQTGTVISNAATNQVNANPAITSNSVTVTVVEPVITFTKAIISTPVPLDAGGVVHYQITYANAAGASTAMDVHITDALAAALLLPSTGAPDLVITPSAGVGAVTNNSTTSNIDITIASVPAGESVTVDFYPVIQASVTPGQLIDNVGNATWTSLSGVVSGERTGAGGVDDYNATSPTVSFNIHDPAFSKSIDHTSATHTIDPSVAIGETITFSLYVTLPEGTTPGITIDDNLPAGLRYVLGSATLDTTGFAGTVHAWSVTPTIPPVGSGDDLSVTIGQVDVDADNDDTNNTFHILFEAVVLNEAGNQSGSVLTNSATMTIGGTTYGPATVNANIVEAVLTVNKIADITNPILGQTITYTIVVQHGGASNLDALAVEVTDSLPAGLEPLTNITITQTPPLCATGVDSSGSAGNNLNVQIARLPLGCQVTITYQSEISSPPDTPAIGTALTNTASVTWTSLGGLGGEERTGSGGVNDYNASDGATVTFANIDMVITKDDGGVSTAPTFLLTYTLHYQNAGDLGATGVVITETVPDYTTFDLAGSTLGWSCTGGEPAGTTCTFNIASVPAGGSGDVIFALRVNNYIPAGVTLIQNTASITDDHTNGLEPTPADNTDSDDTPLDAVPDLAVVKTDGMDTVSPGTTLTYTLTVSNLGSQDATGVAVTDHIPDNTTFVSAGLNPNGLAATYDDPTRTVSWPVFNLAAGVPPANQVTLTVTVQVNDPFPVGVDTITNSAHVQDDGANGPEIILVNNDDDDTDNVVTVENADIAKTLDGTNLGFTADPDVAIGEILTYQIVLTIPPGTMPGMTVTDELDLGLAFVDCLSITPSTVSLTWEDPAAPPPSNDFSSICSSPTVSDLGAAGDPSSPGRQALFTFHDVHNAGVTPATLTIRYRAVVLDVLQNQRGDTLANSVTWEWTGNTPLVAAAPVVTILEPAMQITKTVSPTVALPGSVVVYEIRISHLVPPSNTDAYDVEVRDTVPHGVIYIPGTLVFVSGVPPTTLDETAAPLLRAVWDAYPLGAPETVLRFSAWVGNLQPGVAINNTASVAWTSTPGIPPNAPGAPAGQQSIYNDYSYERRYDPLFPADIYGASASAAFTVPALPATGFAPDRVTALPDQPADQAYADLGNLWLEIPSLGVKVPIVGIPVKGSGWDLTWLSNQTGYLDGTAYPTHSGNSVLTAHVYLPDGSPGPFVNLSSMYWGQQVIVHMDGQRYIYEVREVRRIWPDDLSVMRHEDKPWLTLLTCKEFDTASGTYRYRISVRAVLLRVEPESASSGAKK